MQRRKLQNLVESQRIGISYSRAADLHEQPRPGAQRCVEGCYWKFSSGSRRHLRRLRLPI